MTREFRLLLAYAKVPPNREDEAAIREMLIRGVDWNFFSRGRRWNMGWPRWPDAP
jgi:hypothetical protein